ncbi:CobW family GTP-binding protein [Pseudomonas massiliensis]|uniref:CobW family GTP-binding protein n=1 Tax=Pseudomonas massiliensis TaxID=522492 RepID=UPI00058B48A7|nr:CobW-like GTP-binding protein [Pseudomonas massiliensis]
MFENILTYVLAGPLGAGKTTLARHLLKQHSPGQRWAVLVNEFGDIGLDAALLGADDGSSVVEIAGGCVCCVNGAPFTAALARLIRARKPTHLLIELSGLGHPMPLLDQLRLPPWERVLNIQPPIVVVDALQLARRADSSLSRVRPLLMGRHVLVINKADQVPVHARGEIELSLGHTGYWVSQGALPEEALVSTRAHGPGQPGQPGKRLVAVPSIDAPGHWSRGWRLQPAQRVIRQNIEAMLQRLPWIRAKMILHTEQGWYSANLLPGQPYAWQPTEWRRDSRLELIFDQPQDQADLDAQWARCLG